MPPISSMLFEHARFLRLAFVRPEYLSARAPHARWHRRSASGRGSGWPRRLLGVTLLSGHVPRWPATSAHPSPAAVRSLPRDPPCAPPSVLQAPRAPRKAAHLRVGSRHRTMWFHEDAVELLTATGAWGRSPGKVARGASQNADARTLQRLLAGSAARCASRRRATFPPRRRERARCPRSRGALRVVRSLPRSWSRFMLVVTARRVACSKPVRGSAPPLSRDRFQNRSVRARLRRHRWRTEARRGAADVIVLCRSGLLSRGVQIV